MNPLEHFSFMYSEPQASACAISRSRSRCEGAWCRHTKTRHALKSSARRPGLLALLSAVAWLASVPGIASAGLVYLNNENTTVTLGGDMGTDPFQNQTAANALTNILDAPSADAPENHISPTTHVWVQGGPLELAFDFGVEYDLTTLHFWNYFEEAFDVDNMDFKFYDASMSPVGEVLNVAPTLGGSGGNPIYAQDIALPFPSRVRFANVVLTGTNGQVDFNNIGFTGTVSVPEPATLALLAVGGIALLRRRH